MAHQVSDSNRADVEAALDILLSTELDPIVDVVLTRREGRYEALAHAGRLAFPRSDLGSAAGGVPNPLGSPGIALAWSQIWAADAAHRGLARIDRDTEKVVERIELWPAAAAVPGASGSVGEDGGPPDRWPRARRGCRARPRVRSSGTRA